VRNGSKAVRVRLSSAFRFVPQSRRNALVSTRPGRGADVDNIAGDVREAVEPVAIRR